MKLEKKFSSKRVKIVISSDHIGEVNIQVLRRRKQPLLEFSAHSSDELCEAVKSVSQLLNKRSVCSKHWFLRALKEGEEEAKKNRFEIFNTIEK